MHNDIVAIIGAGPVGLAAAAHALKYGLNPQVYERGAQAGTNMLDWGHVRLFSPWRYLLDEASVALLEAHGWQQPDLGAAPSGREYVERYLAPLAALPELRKRIHFNTEFVAASLENFDKLSTPGRDNDRLSIRVRNEQGLQDISAGALIDASGVWHNPNPLGSNGLRAVGELEFAQHIHYGAPDVLKAGGERYAGRRTLVVGAGHTAANALLDLLRLSQEAPNTEVVWALRRGAARQLAPRDNDQLPARGALGNAVAAALADGRLTQMTNFRVHRLQRGQTRALEVFEAGAQQRSVAVDQVIACTGQRPDLTALQELRLSFDPVLESTPALAPLIDPNEHSCGSVRPHGWRELRHEHEPDVYVIGGKSYGRAPTFLIATGYEQARSVVAALAGDIEAADRVELELPETGVCGVGASQPRVAGACC